MTRSRIDRLIQMQEGLSEISRQSLERLQLEKLNALLRREKARDGFYRNMPESIDSLTRLSELPFTTEGDLARNAPGLLLCSQGEIERVLSDATSGTTGESKRVFYTEGDCRHTVELFMAGLGELIFPGSVTMICFPFSGPRGLGELIAEAVERLGAKPLKLGAAMSYREYARVLDREKPDTFVGMPVQLLGLLRVCGRGSLRRALVSGDACPETVIREAERLLGSRLFPHYGSREMALGGAICCAAHEGMHLRENHVIAEIVDADGRVLPRGEYGELVITTIGMEAMPLIRYRTGDYTRILSKPCPCGSEVLRLDTLQRHGEGAEIAALDEMLFSHPFVADYRVGRRDGKLYLEVLTCGEGVLSIPGTEIIQRPVRPDDHSLYRGKRKIESAI